MLKNAILVFQNCLIRVGIGSTIAAVTICFWLTDTHAQSTEIDDETCLICHEDMGETLLGTTHQLSSQIDKPSITIACVSCHTGGAVHIEEQTAESITNPANAQDSAANALCTQCHQPHTEMGTVGFDPHIGLDLNCVSCHSIHQGAGPLLLDEDTDFCGKCHVSVENEFLRRANHPVRDGNVSCLSCHDFTGVNSVAFGHGGNANCFQCHPLQSGPYLYEHEATSSFSTEGHGCVACHAPHGSPNERLLLQPGDNLCRQCHGLPPRHTINHGGIGTQYSCVECHSEVHGSYDNRYLLDPDLGIKIGGGINACYCHYPSN